MAIFVLGCSQESDIPIGTGTEKPPVPAGYLEKQVKINELQQLVRNNPGDASLLARLGDLYFESGNYSQAVVEYERALAIVPDDVDTHNDLGLAYHYTGRSAQAIEILKKGTAADPSYQRVWLSLGYVLAANGRNDEAAEPLQKAVDLNPDNDVGQEAARILGQITVR